MITIILKHYGLTTTFREGRSPTFTIYTPAEVTGISTAAC